MGRCGYAHHQRRRTRRATPCAEADGRPGDGRCRRRGRRRAVPVAAHGPAPTERADAGLAPSGLDVRAVADPRHPRRTRLVVLGRAPGRCRPPCQPRPAPSIRGVRRRDGRPGVRPALRDRSLRHDPLLDPHGPARPADAGGRAADRARGAGDAHSAWRRQRPGGAGCCRSSTAACCASSPSRSWRGCSSPPSCGQPLLAAVRSRRSRTGWSTTSNTRSTSARRCSSGGPPSGSTRRPWRISHPARLLYVFLQMTQNTFLAVIILNAPDRALPALRDGRAVVGSDAARGSADRRGRHVARRRHHLHRARWRRSSSAGCVPRAGRRPYRPSGGRGDGPDPDAGDATGGAPAPGARPRRRPTLSREWRLRYSRYRRVDVAAARDSHRDTATADPELVAVGTRGRRPTGRPTARRPAGSLRGEADAGRDLRLGDGDDRVERARRWANVRAAERPRPGPVGDRPRDVGRGPARRSRHAASDSRASAASSGSTPITRASGTSRPDRDRDAARQAAATDRDEDQLRRPAALRRSRGRPCPDRRSPGRRRTAG